MSELKSYIPLHIEALHRKISSELAILTAGICSFIASLFANVSTERDGFLSKTPILVNILIFIAFFFTLYWIFIFIWNRYTKSRFYRYKGMGKYDVCHIFNDMLLDDVLKMMKVTCANENELYDRTQFQECLYNIDIMLEFIDQYVNRNLIAEWNFEKHKTGRAYSRITIHQIECVLCGMLFIMTRAKKSLTDENNPSANAYQDSLIQQVNDLATTRYGIKNIKDSIFFID